MLLAGCTLIGASDRSPIEAVYVSQTDSAETLVFRRDFTGERRGVMLSGPADDPTADTIGVTSPFTYQPLGSALLIDLGCPPDAVCVGGPHYRAHLDGSELRLEPLLTESSEPARLFRRI